MSVSREKSGNRGSPNTVPTLYQHCIKTVPTLHQYCIKTVPTEGTLNNNGCDQKKEPTIFLSSGVHTKPKLKNNPNPNPKLSCFFRVRVSVNVRFRFRVRFTFLVSFRFCLSGVTRWDSVGTMLVQCCYLAPSCTHTLPGGSHSESVRFAGLPRWVFEKQVLDRRVRSNPPTPADPSTAVSTPWPSLPNDPGCPECARSVIATCHSCRPVWTAQRSTRPQAPSRP